ncbi:MAG: PatB family C-S lyase [Spirochaetales bacterium]|nr:PatB family C-S lyase [Spirochaetales bacterium]
MRRDGATDGAGAASDALATPDRRGTGSYKWDLAHSDEIPLWVADMDYAVSPVVTEALRRRLDHPIFGYAGVPGSYLEAIAAWEAKRNGWEIPTDHMVVVPGVMPAIAVAVQALTRPGDRIATFSPVYFPFFSVIENLGRRVVRVPLSEEETPSGGRRYRMNLDEVERTLRDVALFLLCSPHNPAGRIWTADELDALRDRARNAGVPVLSDEIHSDLTFPGSRFEPWLRAGGATPHDIALVAPSKTFNIPGLPTATAIVPDPAARRRYLRALESRKLNLPNVLAMTAAEAAYRGAADWLDSVRHAVYDNYLFVCDALSGAAGVSVHAAEATFIPWIDLRERWGLDRDAAARPFADESTGLGESLSERFGRTARECGVWLSDGRQFGPEGEGFMRINVATSRDRLAEGVERVHRALETFDSSR